MVNHGFSVFIAVLRTPGMVLSVTPGAKPMFLETSTDLRNWTPISDQHTRKAPLWSSWIPAGQAIHSSLSARQPILIMTAWIYSYEWEQKRAGPARRASSTGNLCRDRTVAIVSDPKPLAPGHPLGCVVDCDGAFIVVR